MGKVNYKRLQNGSDIRGVAVEGYFGEAQTINPQIAKDIATAFCVWLSRRLGGKTKLKIGVGMDTRISGPELKGGIIEGLITSGVNVFDCGIASTPAMFMTTVTEGFKYDGSIMITASHLPLNRNGLKFFTMDGGLEKSDIGEIIEICENNITEPAILGGRVESVDFMSVYSNYLADKIRVGINDKENFEKPLTGFKIAVDAGNGAGGFFATKVLAPLGADISASRFLEPNGYFPNHIPNPEDKEAMNSIKQAVKEGNCDFGIIFDTDVDRAGAVDCDCNELNKNRLIGLMAAIVLEEHPSSYIVTDSVTSDELKSFIDDSLKGKHFRYKRGYKNVINEAIRLNSVGRECNLAIETSGHGALKENYFLDDGAYLISKIIIKLAKLRLNGKTLNQLLEKLAEPKESTEFRIGIKVDDFKSYGEKVLTRFEQFANDNKKFRIACDNREGIRANLGKSGWFLIRLSLHDPLLPINIESPEVGGIKKIIDEIYPLISSFEILNISAIDKYIEEN